MYKNLPKIKNKCYFTKPASKRVISTGNHLLGPMIYGSNETWAKKRVNFAFAKCMKTARRLGKSNFLRNLLRRG